MQEELKWPCLIYFAWETWSTLVSAFKYSFITLGIEYKLWVVGIHVYRRHKRLLMQCVILFLGTYCISNQICEQKPVFPSLVIFILIGTVGYMHVLAQSVNITAWSIFNTSFNVLKHWYYLNQEKGKCFW